LFFFFAFSINTINWFCNVDLSLYSKKKKIHSECITNLICSWIWFVHFLGILCIYVHEPWWLLFLHVTSMFCIRRMVTSEEKRACHFSSKQVYLNLWVTSELFGGTNQWSCLVLEFFLVRKNLNYVGRFQQWIQCLR
jgi:hypothetical protein